MRNLSGVKNQFLKNRETGPVIEKTPTRLPHPQRTRTVAAEKVVFQG
jgi:hypothetical protein